MLITRFSKRFKIMIIFVPIFISLDPHFHPHPRIELMNSFLYKKQNVFYVDVISILNSLRKFLQLQHLRVILMSLKTAFNQYEECFFSWFLGKYSLIQLFLLHFPKKVRFFNLDCWAAIKLDFLLLHNWTFPKLFQWHNSKL